MLYFVENESGNVSDVTEKIYNRLKNKKDYKCWTEDPYAQLPEVETIGSSTDYTISELRRMRDDYSDSEWKEFTKGDQRKTIDTL